MKKMDLKLLNLACWLEILLTYLLPFQIIDAAQARLGFPFAFLTIYDKPFAINPLMSMHLNPLAFLLNALLLYLVLAQITKGIRRCRATADEVHAA